MLIVFEKLRKINEKLSSLKQRGKIFDYRIILKLNMTVNLYLVTNGVTDVEIDSLIEDKNLQIDIEKLSQEEFKTDEYYASLFQNTQPLDLGLRRSLSNIIDYDDDIVIDSCPIVSFYSYKGGVGRTTALALFASHYSIHKGKRVFVIDCDFEAPGLINFYGLSSEDTPKNGIVEYIKDKEACTDINLHEGYTYEISKRYSGNGEIYLLPAGNIFNDIDRIDYLEALARLDLHSTSTIVNQFKDVIIDINKEFKPDVILIDTRTGLNDVFGIIANKLSNIVVGFFGNNTQNKPGLHFFLNTLLRKARNVDLILVLSIISSSFSKELKFFQGEIEDYVQIAIDEKLGSLPVIPTYYLQRYTSLEKIGTDEEDPEDFITLIEKKALNDYIELFSKLEEYISIHTSQEQRHGDKQHIFELKTSILKKLYDHFPESYAEHIIFTDEFLKSKFYYRRCMEDIFNQDKFLLLGGKGTGKTAFYQALRQENFFQKLQRRVQKQNINYQVVHGISLAGDPEHERDRFINVDAQFPQSEINDPEYFYRRFWLAYFWNVIRLDDHKTNFKSNSKLEVKPIFDDQATATYLKKIVFEDALFNQIEDELYKIDRFLRTQNRYLMIIFDQLDKTVKPINWSKSISPLIRLCQTHNFARIRPKLFLRRDLFNKLGNLTNKESLENQAINLEWTQHELYAFFFKIIFSYSKKEFFDYMRLVETLSNVGIKKIEQTLHQINSYNQLPADYHLLKPLVDTFFGKYADKYGEMYDWIYRNLKNADGTISLRPFLDLIKYAIQKQLGRPELNKGDYPILYHKCFDADVRERAVDRHFKDLAEEEGNEALKIIISDIRNDRVPKELKISSLLQNDFEKLLKHIINQHEELKDNSLTNLEEILKLNGIIFVRHISGGRKKYSFAYLYKYYLGLGSPTKKSYQVKRF